MGTQYKVDTDSLQTQINALSTLLGEFSQNTFSKDVSDVDKGSTHEQINRVYACIQNMREQLIFLIESTRDYFQMFHDAILGNDLTAKISPSGGLIRRGNSVKPLLSNMAKDAKDGGEVGNGRDKYVQWFYDNYKGLDPSKSFGWCDRFTSWVLGQAGIRLSAGGCDGQANQFGSDFHLKESDYTPQEGDIVFLDYNQDGHYDHVGIYYLNNGVPSLLHGNWGDKVQVSDLNSWTQTYKSPTISDCIAGYGDVTSFALSHPLNP